MEAITTIGLDIAKSVFQVHGIDAEGNVILRTEIREIDRTIQLDSLAILEQVMRHFYWKARVLEGMGTEGDYDAVDRVHACRRARAEGHGRRFHLQPLSVCEGEHRSDSGGGQGDARYRHRHDCDHAQ